MTKPIVYVSTFRIKEGQFDDYRRFYAALVRIVDESEPRIAAFLAFANEELTEITNVHVYPDGAALDHHMNVLGEKMGLLPADLTAVTRYLEPVHVDVFGTPEGAAAEMDKGLAASGVALATRPHFLGGFTRNG